MSGKQTRRVFLRGAAGVGAIAAVQLLAACGGQPAAPTAAPAKPAEAPKPAAATPAAPAGPTPTKPPEVAVPTSTPGAVPKVSKEPVTIRYMERAGSLGDGMRHFSRVYEERNPGVTVKNETTSWEDHTTKVATMVAAGTMADVCFQHSSVQLPGLAAKGVWVDPEPLGNADKHDWKQYYKWALDALRLGPNDKLAAMPMGVHSGENLLGWNREHLQKAGVKEPTPDTSVDELTELCVSLKKAVPDIWPIVTPLAVYTMEAHSRSWKGYLISEDRTKCGFDLPETQAAHQYVYDWVHKYKVMPGRAEMQGDYRQMFRSGKLGIAVDGPNNMWVGFNEAVAGRFTLGNTTWPSKPSGVVGTLPSVNGTVIWTKTKYMEHSWGLTKLLSSLEASKWMAVNPPYIGPGAIIQAWNDPDVWKAGPIYKTCAEFWNKLDKEGVKFGANPVPRNTRIQEFSDLYNNEWAAMVYGEKPYDKQAVADLQKKLQAIMDKPMP